MHHVHLLIFCVLVGGAHPKLCEPGLFRLIFSRSKGCFPCPGGKFKSSFDVDESASSVCDECKLGQFQEVWGKESCKACEQGKTGSTAFPTSSADHCQYCTAGSTDVDGVCVTCPIGTFTVWLGNRTSSMQGTLLTCRSCICRRTTVLLRSIATTARWGGTRSWLDR